MREIKFRAWSIGNQCWMYFGINDCPNWVEPAEVEQYTGLKDKNGVEIYEGDICQGGKVHLTGFKLDNGEPGTFVTFREGMFKLGLVSLTSLASQCEVIGNIYENPELLSRGESDAK